MHYYLVRDGRHSPRCSARAHLIPLWRRDTSIADDISDWRISALPQHIDESANGCLVGEIESQDRHVTSSVTHPLSGLFAFLYVPMVTRISPSFY